MKVAIDKYTRIDAKLMIPGRGAPLQNASVILCGSLIIYTGTTLDLPTKFKDLEPFDDVPVLMPGLWDCHVHFMGADEFKVDTMVATPIAVAGIRSARDVVATLNAGYTSVRELGGYGVQLAKVIKEGWLPGPHIYSAVSMLSQTAGHGDVRDVSLKEYWDRIEHSLPAYLCDGPAECIKAVRVQIRKGATLIKVAASGGVVSTGDDIDLPQFNDEELATIVKEATRNNLIVAAHCHASSAIQAALLAGCRTIEHGSNLTDDLVDLMLSRGAILVATCGVTEYTLSLDTWSPEEYQRLVELRNQHTQSYKKAIKAGVRCALGTDLGVSASGQPWNHGMNGVEFKYAVEAGMSPLEAIEAGTATGPETLGPKAPKSGQLREGYDADIIALSTSPLQNIEVLGDPAKVLHVWKGGKLYKRNGKPISILEPLVIDSL